MKTQWKKLFYEDELVDSAEIHNFKLEIYLKDKYQKAGNYRSINQMLVLLWKKTPALKNKFQAPAYHASEPYLILKEGHGYQNGAAALAELRSFAKPLKQAKAKKVVKPAQDVEQIFEAAIEKPIPKSPSDDPFADLDFNFEKELDLDNFTSGFRIPSFNDLSLPTTDLKRSRELIFSPYTLPAASDTLAPTEKAEAQAQQVPKLYFPMPKKQTL